MNDICFGIVGSGRMAALMMPAFRHADGVRAAAVYSSNAERANAFAAAHGIGAAYHSLETLLADIHIDAIYVANGTSDHAATAIAALEAGKHVLCEKPFAISAEEGERVIAAARQSGKLFMEGLWTHFLPAYVRVLDLMRARMVGDPVHLLTDFAYPATAEQFPRLFSLNGGGVLLDRAVYPISLALNLMGPVKDLQAKVIRNRDGVDVHVNIQTRHENGTTSQLAASMIAMMSNSASIACSEGLISIPPPILGAETVRVEYFAAPVASPDGAVNKLKGALKRNPFLRRVKSAFGSSGERHAYGANQYLPQLQHFRDLIMSEKTESDVVSHALSLDVLQIIDRIRAAENT